MKRFLPIILFIVIGCRSDSGDVVSELANRVPSDFPTAFTVMRPNNDPAANIIGGIRWTCDYIKMSNVQNRHNAWGALTIRGGYWIQTGYGNNYGITMPFIQVYKNGQISDISPTVINTIHIAFGKRVTFAIYNINTTTKWRVSINNIDWVELDLQGNDGASPELATEESGGNKYSRFPVVNFYPAMEVLVNGNWISVKSGICTAADAWGLEGKIQNPLLRDNELNIGSGLTGKYNDILW